MNSENLKSFGDGSRSPEDEKAMQAKGGKNSGAARRRKRTMKQVATELLKMPPGSDVAAKLDELNVPKDEQSNMIAIIFSMIVKAIDGDVKAATFLRDTIFENPADNLRETDMKQRHKIEEQRLEFEREKFKCWQLQQYGLDTEYEDLSDAEKEIYGVDSQEIELEKQLPQLSDAEAGQLFKAIMQYGQNGEVPELSGAAEKAFKSIRGRLDRDAARYEEISQRYIERETLNRATRD